MLKNWYHVFKRKLSKGPFQVCNFWLPLFCLSLQSGGITTEVPNHISSLCHQGEAAPLTSSTGCLNALHLPTVHTLAGSARPFPCWVRGPFQIHRDRGAAALPGHGTPSPPPLRRRRPDPSSASFGRRLGPVLTFSPVSLCKTEIQIIQWENLKPMRHGTLREYLPCDRECSKHLTSMNVVNLTITL